MRNELVEGILLGTGIALAIIAIRALMSGASSRAQALALLLIGVGLCVVQFVLIVRRARRDGAPSHKPVETPRPAMRKRPGPRDPFARELTRDWTGLGQGTPESGAMVQIDAPASSAQDLREWRVLPADPSDETAPHSSPPDHDEHEH